MYMFSSIHKEHIIFSNSLTDRSVFLHQIECCKIQFTSIKPNLVLSKQKLIVDKYSRYRQAESIRLKFVSGYHISLILCIQDHPNYQNIQNMACPHIVVRQRNLVEISIHSGRWEWTIFSCIKIRRIKWNILIEHCLM